MKKCPKCNQMKLESTTGGLTHMVWYQLYECINCNTKVEKELKEWKHLMMTQYSVINTESNPISLTYV
jgi:hypothetical protein